MLNRILEDQAARTVLAAMMLLAGAAGLAVSTAEPIEPIGQPPFAHARTGWPAWMPETLTTWQQPISLAATEFGVPVELLAVVTLVESGGYPLAVSGSGARGLLQIMPGTAAEI